MATDFGSVNFRRMEDMKFNCSLNPSDSIFDKRLKTDMKEEDLVELLWADGQVVMHNQKLRLHRQTQEGLYIGGSAGAGSSSLPADQDLLIHEDEMTSWLLQYPNDDSDRGLGSDLFYSPAGSFPPVAEASPSSTKPNLPPIPSPDADKAAASGLKGKAHQAEPLRVVIPSIADVNAAAPKLTEKQAGEGDPAFTSSSGGSSASDVQGSKPPTAADKKKRKRDGNKLDGQIELPLQNGEFGRECGKDPTLDHVEEKKPAPSARRKRAAEVHNLSERRRRDRINEKMKALQELIPHCNKSDKASMLDEAIEYLKSLQSQLKQFMHMYSGMTPVVYPAVQPYIAPIGMRVGVGMGMGMDLPSNSLSRPMLPFQPVVHGVASNLGQRFPISPLPIPHISLSDQPIRAQATSGQADASFHLVALPTANAPRPLINLPDPYQQNYLAFNPIPKAQQAETNVTPLHTFERTEDPDSKKIG